MITLVDLEISNLNSVVQAFRRVGAEVTLASEANALEEAQAVVLPGVGSFPEGMAGLRRRGLVEPIRRLAGAGRPIFGICLGMQLLAETSEENGPTLGLGLIDGAVTRLRPRNPEGRVPNIGWCDISTRPDSRLFRGISDGTPFYFAHSYRLVAGDEADVSATIDHDDDTAVIAIERGHLLGVQFHPEKSQDVGLRVLANFLDILHEGPARAHQVSVGAP